MTPDEVVATTKESTWTGGAHRHIAVLRLSNGSLVAASAAITNIRNGLASYHVNTKLGRVEVEVVDRCVRCSRPDLRTIGSIGNELLLRLPDR